MKSFNPAYTTLPLEDVALPDKRRSESVEVVERALREYIDDSTEQELANDLSEAVVKPADEVEVSEADQLHSEAKHRLTEGLLEEALTLISRARKADPSSLALILTKADVLIELGQVDDAIDVATVGSTLHELDPTVHGLLGRLWMMKALKESGRERADSLLLADQYCSRAFELGCDDVLTFLEAASVCVLRADLDGAEDYLMQATSIHPYHPMANFLLGELAFSNGEWAKAESYLSEASLMESAWKPDADRLLMRLHRVGYRTPVASHGPLYSAARWFGGFALACVLAIVPTLFFWVGVDSFTGYFPSIGALLFSVPVVPTLGFVGKSIYDNFRFEQARRHLMISAPELESDSLRLLVDPRS